MVLIADLLDEFDLEAFNYAGTVRQGGRALAELSVPEEGACPVCGGEVEQPPRGRRRKFCSSRCRWAARNDRVMRSSKA